MKGRSELDHRNTSIDKAALIKCRDLVVLNIPYGANDEDVESYFSKFGNLDFVELKRDRENKSRGFAFVRFADIEAQRACLMSKHRMMDREITVKRPKTKDEELIEKCLNRLFIAKLSPTLTEEDLKEYFGQFGHIKEVCIPPNTKGFAFVTYHSIEGVYEALDVGEDHYIKNLRVVATFAQPKTRDTMNMEKSRGMERRGDRNDGFDRPRYEERREVRREPIRGDRYNFDGPRRRDPYERDMDYREPPFAGRPPMHDDFGNGRFDRNEATKRDRISRSPIRSRDIPVREPYRDVPARDNFREYPREPFPPAARESFRDAPRDAARGMSREMYKESNQAPSYDNYGGYQSYDYGRAPGGYY